MRCSEYYRGWQSSPGWCTGAAIAYPISMVLPKFSVYFVRKFSSFADFGCKQSSLVIDSVPTQSLHSCCRATAYIVKSSFPCLALKRTGESDPIRALSGRFISVTSRTRYPLDGDCARCNVLALQFSGLATLFADCMGSLMATCGIHGVCHSPLHCT